MRISRDIAGHGDGVARQEEACHALAEKLGFEVVQIYRDNDISAYSGKKRPGYESMLEDIQEGQLDAVICWHADRLHRRTAELERYIDICSARHVATHQVQAGELDLATPSGQAVAKTLGAWAQYESAHKSERLLAQQAQNARRARHLGGRRPFGWDIVNHVGVIREDEAEPIRIGIQMICDGFMLVDVVRRWEEMGVRSLSGKKMGVTQVKRILVRPRNAGLVIYRGETVSDEWPRIVSVEDFRKAEAILNSERVKSEQYHKRRYLLSGILACHCGRPMTGFQDNRTPAQGWYRCSVHQEGGRYVSGHAQRRMGPIDDYLMSVVTAYLAREDVREALTRRLEKIATPSPTLDDEKLGTLLDRKASLARMFAQGHITEMQLVEGSREIENALSRLEAQVRRNTGSPALATLLTDFDPAEKFQSLTVLQRREIIKSLLSAQCVKGAKKTGKGLNLDAVTITWKSMEVVQ